MKVTKMNEKETTQIEETKQDKTTSDEQEDMETLVAVTVCVL